jgi:translation initiation factor IF-1
MCAPSMRLAVGGAKLRPSRPEAAGKGATEQWDLPGWRERAECESGSGDLARDDLIQATGTVDKILGGGRYQITLDSGQVVTAQLSGRMRRFRIRVIPGDRVQIGVSPYDPTHGFVTFRLREGQSPPK